MKAICPRPFCGQPIAEHKASECTGTYDDELAEEREATRLQLLESLRRVRENNDEMRAVLAHYATARHAWGAR